MDHAAMKIIKELLDDVLVIEPQVFEDNRGVFFESYSFKKLKNYIKALGIYEYILGDAPDDVEIQRSVTRSASSPSRSMSSS